MVCALRGWRLLKFGKNMKMFVPLTLIIDTHVHMTCKFEQIWTQGHRQCIYMHTICIYSHTYSNKNLLLYLMFIFSYKRMILFSLQKSDRWLGVSHFPPYITSVFFVLLFFSSYPIIILIQQRY